MRWPPVTFTVGIWYLSTTSAMRRSFAGGGLAAPHARDDRVGAVLLDVGVARSLMKRDCGSSLASFGQVQIR